MTAALRPFAVRYTLRNGTRGVVHTLAPSSIDALLIVLDHFGDDADNAPQRISSEAR